MPTLSVIVTTYNWESALEAALKALFAQKTQPLEIIIADDGSTEATAQCIERLRAQSPCPVRHIWQADVGFRAAKIRNRAIAMAKGEYLIFIDGDCLVLPGFIAQHQRLAETGWFVGGNRLLLSQSFTQKILSNALSIHAQSAWKWLKIRWQNDSNRWFPGLKLPLGPLRKSRPARWQGVKTCNMGVWRLDLLRINGFDEAFEGWGYEDSDAVLRLQRMGLKRKEGRFAVLVAHLWHKEQSRAQADANWQRFLSVCQNTTHTTAKKGVTQYLEDI